jgi:hypothetical protein
LVALFQELAVRTLPGPLGWRFGVFAVAARFSLCLAALARTFGVDRAPLLADGRDKRLIHRVASNVSR